MYIWRGREGQGVGTETGLEPAKDFHEKEEGIGFI